MKSAFKRPSFENIAHLPGVYIFKTALDTILYIGKARNLYKRVRSYFTNGVIDWKIEQLLSQYDHVDCIVTKTERDASLLEAELISTHKPPFNILLKGDTPFTYLVFDETDLKSGPVIFLTRILHEKKKKSDDYTVFGPFLSKRHATQTYEFLIKIFQIACCGKSIAQGCLEYHLGVCSGSCMASFDQNAFLERYQAAKAFLLRDKESYQKIIDLALEKAIKEKRFEAAQRLFIYKQDADLLFSQLTHKQKSDYEKDVQEVLLHVGIADAEYAKGFFDLACLMNKEHVNTIDCFDISHFQGHSIVASCVRFDSASRYLRSVKRYTITSIDTQDDYASLKEALKKRYKVQEDFPDIILIDGGKGQRSSALQVIHEIPVISLAKREERVYTSFHAEGVVLDLHTALGKLLISLRDCTHRAALHYHKKKFRKAHFN